MMKDAVKEALVEKTKENMPTITKIAMGSMIGLVGGAGIALAGGAFLGAGGTLLTLLTIVGAVGGAIGGGVAGYKVDVYMRTLGLTPPAIHICRLENEKVDGKDCPVIEISNFKIIDVEAIQHAIDQSEKTPDKKVGYDFSKKPSYSIKVKLKNPEITLAELDYSNWKNNPDFTFEVTRIGINGEKQLLETKDQAEQEEVIKSLNLLPKFLGDTLYHPGDQLQDKMTIGKNYGASGGIIGKWVDKTVNLFNYYTKGKVSTIDVQPSDGPSENIQTPEFLDELADVAIATGKYKELFGHYEAILLNSSKTALKVDKQKKLEEKRALSSLPGWITTGVSGIAALAFIAIGIICVSLAAFALSNPVGIAIVMAAAIGSFGMALISGVVLAIAAFCTWRIKSIQKAIEKITKDEDSIDNRLNEKLSGLDATKDMLEDLSKSHKNELNLTNKHIGDSCIRIIGRWLYSDSSKFCTTLKLTNNAITSTGAINLAGVIKSNFHLRAIDLTGNNGIGPEAIEAFKNSLATNFTITKFSYNQNIANLSEETKKEIEKQLLINKYIQDPNTPIKDFKDFAESEIKIGVAAKIKNNLDLIFGPTSLKNQKSFAHLVNIYSKIPTDMLPTINQQEVFKMLRESTLKHNPLTKNLSEPHRTNLLEKCLNSFESDKKHTHGIATIYSQLMGFSDGIYDPKNKTNLTKSIHEHIESIASWDSKQYTFEIHIQGLKELLKIAEKDNQNDEAKKLEAIIQISLQQDLEAQFEFLRNPNKTPTSEEISSLKVALKDSITLGLKQHSFPQANKEAQKVIDNFLKIDGLKHLIDNISQENKDNTDELKQLIEVSNTIDPEYLTTPPLNATKLTSLLRSDIPGIKLLKTLNQDAQKKLFAICFRELSKGDNREIKNEDFEYKATLISLMINNNDFFEKGKKLNTKPEEFLTRAFTSHGENIDTDYSTYDDLKFSLIYTRSVSLNDKDIDLKEAKEEADLIDTILQPMIKMEIENSLNTPLNSEDVKKILDENFDLREDFTNSQKYRDIDAAIKKYIAAIIERNKNCEAILYGQDDNIRLQLLIEAYKKDPITLNYLIHMSPTIFEMPEPTDLESLEDSEQDKIRMKISDIDQRRDDLKELIITDLSKLNQLDESRRIKLLENCFDRYENGDKNHRDKAIFIAKISEFCNPGDDDKLSEIIAPAFNRGKNEMRYKDLLIALEEERRKANKDLADTIEKALQAGLQAVLKNKIADLKKENPNVSDLLSLPKELEENMQYFSLLKSHDFTQVTADEEVKKYAKFITSYNKILDLMKDKKSLDLDKFIPLYCDLMEEKTAHNVVFQKIQPIDLLNIIKDDIGKHEKTGFLSYVGVGKTEVKEFKCEKLKKLQKDNPNAFLTLFEHIFRIHGKPEEAKEKALLIDKLLKINELFDPKHKDDPFVKSITTVLYWAMTPWGNTIDYDLKKLQEKLKNISLEASYNQSPLENKEKIFQIIEQEIKKATEEAKKLEVENK